MMTTSRRWFLTTIFSGALARPRTGQAQPSKTARVGWLSTGSTGNSPSAAQLEGFREGLRDGGWVEGRNLTIEFRVGPADGTLETQRAALTRLATELVDLKVDVILASIAGAAIAASRVVHTVPVVFVGVSDPVAFGLVTSLAKPGGNVTGVSLQSADLNPKRLDLVKAAVPDVRKIAVLIAREHTLRERMVTDLRSAAGSTGVTLFVALTEGTDPAELDRAFAAMRREGVGAVVGLPVAWYIRYRQRIAELALKHRLPTIFEWDGFVEAGCLMSYGANTRDMWRLSATYVDRILKGTHPRDLPVQQPTRFDLVVNARTAQTLGLTLPPSLLLRADRIIEQ